MNDVTIIDIISSIGLTMIVTHSFLFKSIRSKLEKTNEYICKLVSCSMCFGFWSLLIVLIIKRYIPVINYCFITSIVCYSFYLIIKPLINKYDK